LAQFGGSALREHERRVAEFMKQAKADNPELVKELEDRLPVLTEDQLRYRRRFEIPLESLDGEFED